MRVRSILVLLVAMALAGASVYMAQQVIAERTATRAEAERPKGPELTTVVVARVPLYFGSKLTRENLTTVEWPKASVPPGSFSSLDDVLSADEPRVALQAIETSEPVLEAKVSGFGGRATLSTVIADGMRAMTIRVDDVYGVAGFVLPGDRVDVLITRDEGDRDRPITDILLQNVKVLGIDQEASERKDTPKVARAVTLEVTPEQAQKLTLGSTVGTLSLALRNQTNVEAAEQKTIGVNDLRVGEVNQEAPADAVEAKAEDAPKSKPAPRKKSGDDGSNIRVFRGSAPSDYKVRREPASSSARRPATSAAPDRSAGLYPTLAPQVSSIETSPRR